MPIVMIMDENQVFDLIDCPAIADTAHAEEQKALLIRAVTHLLETDFPRLCQILYRVDVDERLLKETLAGSAEPPAEIIARLLLERQKQKVALRRRYTRTPDNIAEEDKW